VKAKGWRAAISSVFQANFNQNQNHTDLPKGSSPIDGFFAPIDG
jgi:hypothetical protein